MSQKIADSLEKTKKLVGKINSLRKMIFYVLFFFVLVIIIFFFSESYRVGNGLKKMDLYKEYLIIQSPLNSVEMRTKKLSDFYVASSFRSCLVKNQRFDYVSVKMLESVIESGARFIWLDVFNQEIQTDTIPIVSNGVDKGNWKYMLNTVTFEECVEKIAATAFNPGMINNYGDPLILALNLNVQNNIITLNKIRNILIKHLKTKLLPSRYGFLNKDIGSVEIQQLLGKVIIFTSGGYQDSGLTELINYSWDKPKLRVVSNNSLETDVAQVDEVKLDLKEVKDFNSQGMTIVLPDEDTIRTFNYDPTIAFENGCQFVAMNYLLPDKFMDEYVTKFRESSFILRPKEMTGSQSYDTEINLNKSQLQTQNNEAQGTSSCPTEPLEFDNLDIDKDSLNPDTPIYKRTDKDLGVCVFNTKCTGRWKEFKPNIPLVSTENEIFNLGKDNLSAGMDKEGNQYKNWNTKLCCSTETSNDVEKSYIMAPQCSSPDSFVSNIGIKINTDKLKDLPYVTGNKSGKQTWIHPKLCKVTDNKDLNTQRFCTLSKHKCPKGWTKNITLDNNLKMCCKNID